MKSFEVIARWNSIKSGYGKRTFLVLLKPRDVKDMVTWGKQREKGLINDATGLYNLSNQCIFVMVSLDVIWQSL